MFRYQKISPFLHRFCLYKCTDALGISPVAARGQGAPGQMTWLKGFRPGSQPGFRPGCHFYSAAALLAMQSGVIPTAIPSVCPSVTRWYPIQTNERRITWSSL